MCRRTVELSIPAYSGSSVVYEWFFDDGTGSVAVVNNSNILSIPTAELTDNLSLIHI